MKKKELIKIVILLSVTILLGMSYLLLKKNNEKSNNYLKGYLIRQGFKEVNNTYLKEIGTLKSFNQNKNLGKKAHYTSFLFNQKTNNFIKTDYYYEDGYSYIFTGNYDLKSKIYFDYELVLGEYSQFLSGYYDTNLKEVKCESINEEEKSSDCSLALNSIRLMEIDILNLTKDKKIFFSKES